eukprot:3443174-Pleurochrysis_carterae.AAC.1
MRKGRSALKHTPWTRWSKSSWSGQPGANVLRKSVSRCDVGVAVVSMRRGTPSGLRSQRRPLAAGTSADSGKHSGGGRFCMAASPSAAMRRSQRR